MTDSGTRSVWLSDRSGLLFLAVLSALVAGLILLTHLQYILLGALLAYLLAPAQRRLEPRLGPNRSAAVLILATIFAILLPVAYLLVVAIQQGLRYVAALRAGEFEADVLQDALASVGVEADVMVLLRTHQDSIVPGLEYFATGALAVIGGIPGVIIGLTMSLFVLFALLKDGDRLRAWARHVFPIGADTEAELVRRLDNLLWASVVGNVAVAAIQALLLGLGVFLLGVSGVVFFTVLTFILALLPLVGAFGVWVPLAGYLFLSGQPVAGGLLVAYGSLISASDIYLRPVIVNRSAALNTATIVVGIFGGLIIFGAIGLFIGPVALGGAKIALELLADERATVAGT